MPDTYNINQQDVKDTIRAEMYNRGWTYAELAERMNLAIQTIRNELSPSYKLLPSTIKRFCQALDCPYESVIQGAPTRITSRISDIEDRLAELERQMRIVLDWKSSFNRR